MVRQEQARESASNHNEEKIRKRIHAQWKRRAWFVGHALTFASVIILTAVFFRSSLRVMALIFAVWACVVAIHAVIFYLYEERDISVQRAIERAEEKKRKNEELAALADEDVMIGTDGEFLPPSDDLFNDSSFNDSSSNDSSFNDDVKRNR